MKTNAYVNPEVLVPGSPEQKAIWEFLKNGAEHGLVEARAGSGKTFTIVQGALRLSPGPRVSIFSFNRHIVKEANARLQRLGIGAVRANTYHSFGFRAVRSAFPNVQLVQDKLETIVRRYALDRRAFVFLLKLTRLCKDYLADGTSRVALDRIVERHGLDIEEERQVGLLRIIPRILQDCLEQSGVVDFDDQIWWTVKLGLPVEHFDLLLVDEAQDTNKAQQALIFMACPEGRIVIVGDRFQSIYGFRGADASAIPSLYDALSRTERGCKILPLTVTRRCPKSHVRLAQALVPDLQAMGDAPEGEILKVRHKKAVDMMEPGDMVLCRVNRFLVPVALELLGRGVKALVCGRDFGKGLIALILSLNPLDVLDLHQELGHYYAWESAKLQALGDKGTSRLVDLQDQVECIVELSKGVEEIPELTQKIERIFADYEEDGRPRDAVLLGTVHRTKGLEANTVFVLAPDLIPHPLAKQEWEREQERNLAYVAATRSKFEAGRHPGRLIFVGAIPCIYRAGCQPEAIAGFLSMIPSLSNSPTVENSVARRAVSLNPDTFERYE